MEEMIINEEEHSDDEVIAVSDIVLPSGFHWDDVKPVIIKNQLGNIIKTTIPTRKFVSNQVSYGHLIY